MPLLGGHIGLCFHLGCEKSCFSFSRCILCLQEVMRMLFHLYTLLVSHGNQLLVHLCELLFRSEELRSCLGLFVAEGGEICTCFAVCFNSFLSGSCCGLLCLFHPGLCFGEFPLKFHNRELLLGFLIFEHCEVFLVLLTLCLESHGQPVHFLLGVVYSSFASTADLLYFSRHLAFGCFYVHQFLCQIAPRGFDIHASLLQ
mmetsp:Transcript_6460/g.23998  ORF Transcript_6460/g.23998 Transcript_6460/m.23998 type:complete len:200 (+) Transcript_6460:3456-4055(+)